jgi:putative ABC transport system permease protein
MDLSYEQVGLAALLVLINAAISLLLHLGLGRRLLVASVRLVVQLLLVGLVLHWVFANSNSWTVLALMLVMAITAGVVAVQRMDRRFPGIWLDSIFSSWASSWFITGLALWVIVPARPWYQPQYAIPLLGMVLGNTLSGVSLGLDRLTEELTSRREQVETLLALGATRWEAARLPVQAAVRTGMVPVLNSMVAAGIVSLPGMMTGQMLAGVSPIAAVKYQIVIMFLIASASALGTVGVVLLAYRGLFSAWHQFLSARLTRKR